MRAPFLALVGTVVLAAAAAGPAQARSLEFEPCAGTPDYECASLDVPLDPEARAPGALRLHVRRLVETRDGSQVLVALAGGPGQGSTRFIDDFADVLAEGLEDRQLIVLDQRGTGDSGALTCDALRSIPLTAPAARLSPRVGRCGRQLGDRRRSYTTTEAVADLEALRRGLGVQRLSLFGVSHGAYVAQRYARRYPAAVDGLVLDSPLPQDQNGPFDHPSYAAVSRILGQLCAVGRCRGITRSPLDDVRALAARLRRAPLAGRFFDARGRARAVRLGGEPALFDLLVSSDFSPRLRAALPAAMASARRGDRAPLLRLLAIDNGLADQSDGDEAPQEFSNALFFATSCQEKPVPWTTPAAPLAERGPLRRAALTALPSAVFSPFSRAAADSTLLGTKLCERWPPTAVAPVPQPGPIDAPALVLSGLTDLRTPTEGARRVASLITDASLVAVPGAGHSVVSSRLRCVETALTRFFASEAVGNPCAGRAASAYGTAPSLRAPVRLSRVPLRGLRGLGARLAAGAFATVRDAAEVVAMQGVLDRPLGFGGLRGGSACARPGEVGADGQRAVRLTFDRSSYLPGLLVSGRAVLAGRRIVSARLSVRRRPGLRTDLALAGRHLIRSVGSRRAAGRVPVRALSVRNVSVAGALGAAGRGCR